MTRGRHLQAAALILLASIVHGCAHGEANLKYLGEADLQYYRDAASRVDYSSITQELSDEVKFTGRPHTILDRNKDKVRDISLEEVIQLALTNNAIIRPNSFRSPGNPLYSNASRISSIYDPAIQETGVLFGGRGLEAALSAFDAQFDASMVWGRNETALNSSAAPGSSLWQETGRFRTGLSKQFAYGGSVALNHDWDYLSSNSAGSLFPSSYAGTVGMEYRLPLLAGAGPEFTRIAGPIGRSFQGLSGVNQGVAIARINNDITVAQFEGNIRNLLKDAEDLYWDLYLAYRLYKTAVTSRESARSTWSKAQTQVAIGGGAEGFFVTDEPESRDAFFHRDAQAKDALANIYSIETRLREKLGMPVNDGFVLRPKDSPTLAQFVPDWRASLAEALTRRVELRQQKWSIKSLELQLTAAESLARPRLDFVAGSRVNGFGDQLISRSDNDGVTSQGWHNGFETLTQGDHTGWNLGWQMTMPLGFRSAHTQVRNVELRLAKARNVLAVQEQEIAHELAVAFQDLASNYATAQSHFNRRRAAEKAAKQYLALVLGGGRAGANVIDLELRAQERLAAAESDYYSSLLSYNKSITDLQYRKGTLLEYNGVQLAEGEWEPEAHQQALRRAWARTYAFDSEQMHAEPAEFAAEGLLDDPDLRGLIPTDEGPEMLEPVPELDLGPAEDGSAEPAGVPPLPTTSPEQASLEPALLQPTLIEAAYPEPTYPELVIPEPTREEPPLLDLEPTESALPKTTPAKPVPVDNDSVRIDRMFDETFEPSGNQTTSRQEPPFRRWLPAHTVDPNNTADSKIIPIRYIPSETDLPPARTDDVQSDPAWWTSGDAPQE